MQRVTQTGKQNKTHYAQRPKHTACTSQYRRGPRPCAEPWAELSRAADSLACQGSLITFQKNEWGHIFPRRARAATHAAQEKREALRQPHGISSTDTDRGQRLHQLSGHASLGVTARFLSVTSVGGAGRGSEVRRKNAAFREHPTSCFPRFSPSPFVSQTEQNRSKR